MMPPHLMRLTGTLRNSQSIVLSFWLAVLCCSQGIAGQGRAGLRAEVRRKSLRNFVARASGDQDPLGQEQASQAQAPQSSPSPQVQAGQTLFTALCELPSRFRSRRRSEEHTSELQSRLQLVFRLLLLKKKKKQNRCTPLRVIQST